MGLDIDKVVKQIVEKFNIDNHEKYNGHHLSITDPKIFNIVENIFNVGLRSFRKEWSHINVGPKYKEHTFNFIRKKKMFTITIRLDH